MDSYAAVLPLSRYFKIEINCYVTAFQLFIQIVAFSFSLQQSSSAVVQCRQLVSVRVCQVQFCLRLTQMCPIFACVISDQDAVRRARLRVLVGEVAEDSEGGERDERSNLHNVDDQPSIICNSLPPAADVAPVAPVAPSLLLDEVPPALLAQHQMQHMDTISVTISKFYFNPKLFFPNQCLEFYYV